MLLFVWLFFKWEALSRKITIPIIHDGQESLEITESPQGPGIEKVSESPKKLRGYTTRFLVLHLLTY